MSQKLSFELSTVKPQQDYRFQMFVEHFMRKENIFTPSQLLSKLQSRKAGRNGSPEKYNDDFEKSFEE
jgi:hypothetical protein